VYSGGSRCWRSPSSVCPSLVTDLVWIYERDLKYVRSTNCACLLCDADSFTSVFQYCCDNRKVTLLLSPDQPTISANVPLPSPMSALRLDMTFRFQVFQVP